MSAAAASSSSFVRCSVEAITGPHNGMKIEFERAVVSVGRGPENDVVLENDPRVSRDHVQIRQSDGTFYIKNLSQKNFILVNGVSTTEARIDSKAVIQIGDTELRFMIHDATNSLEPVAPVQSPGAPVFNMATLRPKAPAPAPISSAMEPRQQAAPPAASFPLPNQPPPWVNPGPQAAPTPMAPAPASGGNQRFKIYGILAVVGVVGFFMMQGGRKQRADDKPFRTSEEIEMVRQQTENEIQVFKERKEKMNETVYKKAYENFIRGYRDYRQGQYGRAQEAFQLVLNLDPENTLAMRYINLSKIRFDELVKFNMLQGQRYLEKQNYRMCRSNFQAVMTMLGTDPTNPEYKEAKSLHERCNAALEGRF